MIQAAKGGYLNTGKRLKVIDRAMISLFTLCTKKGREFCNQTTAWISTGFHFKKHFECWDKYPPMAGAKCEAFNRFFAQRCGYLQQRHTCKKCKLTDAFVLLITVYVLFWKDKANKEKETNGTGELKHRLTATLPQSVCIPGMTHTSMLTLEYMAPLRTSPLRIQMIEAAGLALSAWQVRLRESPALRLTTGPPPMTGSSGGTIDTQN